MSAHTSASTTRIFLAIRLPPIPQDHVADRSSGDHSTSLPSAPAAAMGRVERARTFTSAASGPLSLRPAVDDRPGKHSHPKELRVAHVAPCKRSSNLYEVPHYGALTIDWIGDADERANR